MTVIAFPGLDLSDQFGPPDHRSLPLGYRASLSAAGSRRFIAPRFLLRDRDASYGQTFHDRAQAMGIEEVVTAPRSPWQNAYVERIIGLIRRECVDHAIVFNERHLRRVLSAYFEYRHRSPTHILLGKDCPEPRPVQLPSASTVVAFPRIGGLHNRYERRAARTVCGDRTCIAVEVPGVVTVRNRPTRMPWCPEPLQEAQIAAAANTLFE